MRHELIYTDQPKSKLVNRKIYLQLGAANTTVGPKVMIQLQNLSLIRQPQQCRLLHHQAATHIFRQIATAQATTPAAWRPPLHQQLRLRGAGSVLN